MGCTQSQEHIVANQNLVANLVVSHHAEAQFVDFYTVYEELGKGSYGCVSLAVKKDSKQRFAVKVYSKTGDHAAAAIDETAIWKGVQHPNIVRLVETFEDKDNMYLLMEICEGGPMLKRIQQLGTGFPEPYVRKVMTQLISAVSYLHGCGICHRDIKMDNVLLESTAEDAEVKLCDFGSATRFEAGEMLSTVMGTIYYMAPEVFNGEYNNLCDMWSLGVVMYMMLSGKMPFFGNTEDEVVQMIQSGKVDFTLPVWSTVSAPAKSLLKRLLQTDPLKRYTADQVLKHPWITSEKRCMQRRNSDSLFLRLSTFSKYEKVKKAAFLVMAFTLLPKEVQDIRELFNQLDYTHNGVISLPVLKEALSVNGHSDQEIQEIFEQLQDDVGHGVNFLEFVAAMVPPTRYMESWRLENAFRILDRTNSGVITVEDMKQLFGDEFEPTLVSQLIVTMDSDGDGKVTFQDFKQSMEKYAHDHQQTSSLILSTSDADSPTAPQESPINKPGKIFQSIEAPENRTLDDSPAVDIGGIKIESVQPPIKEEVSTPQQQTAAEDPASQVSAAQTQQSSDVSGESERAAPSANDAGAQQGASIPLSEKNDASSSSVVEKLGSDVDGESAETVRRASPVPTSS